MSVDDNQPPTSATIAGITLDQDQIAQIRCSFCLNSMLQTTVVNQEPITTRVTPASFPTKDGDGNAIACFCDDCYEKPWADAKSAVYIDETNDIIRNVYITGWDLAAP